MAWIESHQSLGQHPKLRKLAALLGVSRPCAVGHLHYFWWWCMEYAEAGDLERYDEIDIALGADWSGDAGDFVEAMDRAGFLDRGESGWLVHDWMDYAGILLERRRADAERKRAYRERTSGGRPVDATRTSSGRGADVRVPSAVTVPNRTQPDPTEPKHERAARVRAGDLEVPDGFNRFWAMYPVKKAKPAALAAWKKKGLGAGEIELVVRALETQKRGWTEPRFIPHPATWINQERWNDEVLVTAPGRAEAGVNPFRDMLEQEVGDDEIRDDAAAGDSAFAVSANGRW